MEHLTKLLVSESVRVKFHKFAANQSILVMHFYLLYSRSERLPLFIFNLYITEFLHVKPGKGAAFVRSKLKNFITGNTVDRTWRAGESVEIANVDKKESQFTYADGDEYVFMDMSTYEETRVKYDEAWAKYMKEGMDVSVLVWNGNVISVDVPNTVELMITETDPGVKGNTAQGGSKPATLETGAVVQVPLFIQQGETIKVDTRTDTYLSRVN